MATDLAYVRRLKRTSPLASRWLSYDGPWARESADARVRRDPAHADERAISRR
jgi:hypothetical protein